MKGRGHRSALPPGGQPQWPEHLRVPLRPGVADPGTHWSSWASRGPAGICLFGVGGGQLMPKRLMDPPEPLSRAGPSRGTGRRRSFTDEQNLLSSCARRRARWSRQKSGLFLQLWCLSHAHLQDGSLWGRVLGTRRGWTHAGTSAPGAEVWLGPWPGLPLLASGMGPRKARLTERALQSGCRGDRAREEPPAPRRGRQPDGRPGRVAP